jgi:tetratricopeptide (TPR) repeat protein/WD40 repeat protein
VIACRFAPASELLATGSWDGTVRLWDAAAGEALLTTPESFLGFAPDGRRAAFLEGPTLRIRDVARDQEVHTLNPAGIDNPTEITQDHGVRAARFHPDGRLVALASGGGVHLYGASDIRELAHLKAGSCETVLFDADGRNLITSGRWGLFRWPIRPDPDGGAEALRVGPPELLQEAASGGGEWYNASWLPDHRTLAMIDNPSAHVLLVDTTRPRQASIRVRALSSGSNHRMTSIAISPDGRWAATGGWRERGIYVWDLPQRRREQVLPPSDGQGDSQTIVDFSPDGRWLVSCSHNGIAPGYYVWEVGTWKRGPVVSKSLPSGWGAPVFSADGRLVALSVSSQQIRLAETTTFRPLTHLRTLQPLGAKPLAFSPDGTKLLAATNRKTALMWDLRRIRQRLGPMDVDWEQPSFPPEGESPRTRRPSVRSIRVVGEVLEPSTRRAAELAALNQRLQAHPDDADALFERGGVELRLVRWSEAIADLEKGLRLRPDDPHAHLLLADAYYHTGSLSAARTALDRHLARAPDDPDARLERGLVALRLGQSQVAADDFTRVLAADPDHEVARDRRARAWLALGRLDDALADLDELIRSDSYNATFFVLRGQVHQRLGHHQAAQGDHDRVAVLLGQNAVKLNNAAWELATGVVYVRDPERAVSLARKAVTAATDQPLILNTLGVALYRAGRHAQAIAPLEKSLEAGKGASDAFDLFFLAMARFKLGQITQARADFDRAVRWRRDHLNLPQPGWFDELDAFQAEARALLDGPPAELPADVFAPE